MRLKNLSLWQRINSFVFFISLCNVRSNRKQELSIIDKGELGTVYTKDETKSKRKIYRTGQTVANGGEKKGNYKISKISLIYLSVIFISSALKKESSTSTHEVP